MSSSAHPMTRMLFRMTSRSNSFGAAFLGLRVPEAGGGANAATVSHMDSTSIAVSLPWPAWLSRADGQMCLAAALAIADETSTFGMAAWDAQLRPGVSVSLSGHRTAAAKIDPGEKITFASRLIKGGATLAWIDLKVFRGRDELPLMSGRHLKFQPSGLPPGWSLLAHPLCRPALYSAMEMAVQNGYSPFERLSTADPIPLPAEGTSRMDALSIVGPCDAEPQTADPLLPGDAVHKTFTASLTRQHGNPGASLHGGCAAMLLDEVASAGYRSTMAVEAAPPVQRMHINLLGAIPVPRHAKPPRPVALRTAVSAAEARAHAVLSAPGKSVAAVEADVWW